MAENSVQVEKPRAFKCDYCQQTFLRPEHLTRHVRGAHTDERPFACTVCSSTFHRQDVLNRHIRGMHKQEVELSFRAHTVADFERNAKRKKARQANGKRKQSSSLESEAQRQSAGSGPTMGMEGENMMSSQVPREQFQQPSIQDPVPLQDGGVGIGWPGDFSAFDWELTGADLSGLLYDADLVSGPSAWPAYPMSVEATPGHESLDPGPWNSPFAPFSQDVWMTDPNMMSHVNRPPEEQHLEETIQVQQSYHTPLDMSNSTPHVLKGEYHDKSPLEHPQSDQYFGVLEEHKNDSDMGTSPASASDISARRLPPSVFLEEDGYALIRSNVEPFLKEFRFPVRSVINRWLEAYFKGFNPHTPIFHIPTLDVKTLDVPLFLAICSIGALYCLEREKAWKLYDASSCRVYMNMKARRTSSAGTPLSTMQTLLLNIYFGVWSGDRFSFEESQASASRLAVILQNEAQYQPSTSHVSELRPAERLWTEFIQQESFRRLYFSAYTLMLTISEVFGIPAPIILTDCALPLPSSEAEWSASSASSWHSIFKSPTHVPTPDFRVAMATTLSGFASISSVGLGLDHASKMYFSNFSSMGGHVLVLSVFMHTYHLSVVKRSENLRINFHADEVKVGRIDDDNTDQTAFKEQFPSSSQVSDLKKALKRWQLGWRGNPESLMSPTNPWGPVSFNSTAHYRVINLRLYSDFTSIRRALRTQDARRVFQAMAGITGSPIQRTADVTETTYPAIAALQIPIRMGIRVFAYTASLTWSIEHYLTAFECALFLAYWLLSVERDGGDALLSASEDEMKKLVVALVEESGEEIVRAKDGREILSCSVLKIWAATFDNVCIWGITKIMGTSLALFAEHILRATEAARTPVGIPIMGNVHV